MTVQPTDKQMAILRAAHQRAQDRLTAALDRKAAAVRATVKRYRPAEDAAEKHVQMTRAALSRAELLAHGIMPGETVVRWQGTLWAARITYSGWPRLVPLRKDGTPHRGRNDHYPPRLDRLQIVSGMTAKGVL